MCQLIGAANKTAADMKISMIEVVDQVRIEVVEQLKLLITLVRNPCRGVFDHMMLWTNARPFHLVFFMAI
jgi:hypothetical protein